MYHFSHSALSKRETDLEVVGQVGATGVARVHGDEDRAGGIQSDLCALKQQCVRPRVDT